MKRVFSVLMSIVIVLSCIVFIMPPNIVLAANNADDIVSIARGELGSTNYSKYYGGNKGAWCADFVSWCAQQAGVDSIAKSSSCYNMYIGMKNNGCQEVSSPQKGDIVFFYCTKCSSTAGKWCHVGIMEDSTYSIEGNRWSNGVSKVERGNSYSHNGDLGYKHRDGIVRKYLRPKYSFPNPVTTTPSIWKNSDSYTVGNSATLTWNSVDNATGYWFSVWYKGEQIVTTQVSGSSEYTLNNLGEGEYTAYITAYNDSSSKQGYVTFRVNYVSGEQTIPNGRYQICSALDNSSVISISGASTDDEANVLLYANERHDNQYFDFEYLGNGYYKITAKHSGKVLDVYWEKMEAGANVQQYYWNNGDNQQWVVKDAGDGYFYIISKSNSLYMDVYGGVASNDVNIDTYTGHGGTSEKWKLIPAGEKSVADGKYQICTALDDSSVISISEASKDACANALLYANENHKN